MFTCSLSTATLICAVKKSCKPFEACNHQWLCISNDYMFSNTSLRARKVSKCFDGNEIQLVRVFLARESARNQIVHRLSSVVGFVLYFFMNVHYCSAFSLS